MPMAKAKKKQTTKKNNKKAPPKLAYDELVIVIENMDGHANAYQFTGDKSLKDAVAAGQFVVNENMKFFRLGAILDISVTTEDVPKPTEVLRIV